MGKVSALGILILLTQAGTGISSGQTGSQNDAATFVGTWRLVGYVSNDGLIRNRGTQPTGLIYYDALGNMAAQIMPDRVRPKYAAAEPTPEEAKAALVGYTAYFGTYTVDERTRTISHHRKGNINPGQIGDTVVRRYKFAPGDRVILIPAENGNRLTWERVR